MIRAIRTLEDDRYGRLPVVGSDSGKLVGIVTKGDVIKGLLKKLEVVEKGNAAGEDRATLLEQLDLIDRTSAKMFVPRSIVHDYIDVRQFLHDMRERVEG